MNNHTFPKKSKLSPYGYIHHFVNHKERFRSQVFADIHTNCIENLWGRLKDSIWRMEVLSQYEYAIARFFFHQKMTKEEQIIYLWNELCNRS